MMVFSLPWKAGWKVLVDGQPGRLQRVNVGYTGIYLEPGAHDIELIYEAPGVRWGWKLSILFWGIWAIGAVFLRKKKGKHV